MPTRSPASLRHRRSFWIGLGILILLTAAWVQSIGHATLINWSNSRYPIFAGHSNGLISFSISDNTPYLGLCHVPNSLSVITNKPVAAKHIIRQPLIHRDDFGTWFIRIPYWLIISLFLLTWIPFLIWRTRTIRKHLNQIAHLTNP